jgi:hypothetical protein
MWLANSLMMRSAYLAGHLESAPTCTMERAMWLHEADIYGLRFGGPVQGDPWVHRA